MAKHISWKPKYLTLDEIRKLCTGKVYVKLAVNTESMTTTYWMKKRDGKDTES